MAESNAAYYTLVLECVNKIHIKDTRHQWVEDGEPICLDLLLVSRQTLKIQFRQSISNTELSSSVVGGRVLTDLW